MAKKNKNTPKQIESLSYIQFGIISSMEITCTRCDFTEVDVISDQEFEFAVKLKDKGWTATEDEILCAKCSQQLGK